MSICFCLQCVRHPYVGYAYVGYADTVAAWKVTIRITSSSNAPPLALGWQVYLSKLIPPEAGLGGGSANAATALFAVNELAGRPASVEDLQIWSAELGSDITFFLSTGTCYCTGRGEILHPQKPLAQAR